MKNSSGFILLTTLLVVSLLSLLVVTQGQLFFIQFKSFNRLQEKSQAFYELEDVAHQLIHRHKDCMVSEQNSALILTILQSNQCIFRHKQKSYAYVIENLGNYPCIYTLINHHLFSTKHYRLSITQSNRESIIQLRVAEIINQLPCTLTTQSYVKPGVLSWREIDSQHFIND